MSRRADLPGRAVREERTGPPQPKGAGMSARRALITGGAGFIGSNLAASLLDAGDCEVRLLDNLSRAGTQHNAEWLRARDGSRGRLRLLRGDVRDAARVREAAEGVTEIYHLAAQVAVTTSVDAPRNDFEVNAMGTLNVLEAARGVAAETGTAPMVLFTSTNKVYGGLEQTRVERRGDCYAVAESRFRGVTEETPLDFHSPYGCSKGAADQYVRDYARIYGLPTVVFRMSCICGPRQFGTEDQGWVAHFLYSALAGKPVTIYGDGCQVRDLLHVEDLIAAMALAREHLGTTRGGIYNVGGGPEQAMSIRQLLKRIEEQTGHAVKCLRGEVRPGDQPLYISNCDKLLRDTGWRPRLSVNRILEDLDRFWHEHQAALGAVAGDRRYLRERPVEAAMAQGVGL